MGDGTHSDLADGAEHARRHLPGGEHPERELADPQPSPIAASTLIAPTATWPIATTPIATCRIAITPTAGGRRPLDRSIP